MSDRISKRINIVIHDDQAPGIVEFLDGLPGRAESAFLRGLVYQWLLSNREAPDFDDRISAVLDGPGGRAVLSTVGGARAPAPRRRPGPRPGARPASRQRAQTVMPGVDAPRPPVSDQRLPEGPAAPTTLSTVAVPVSIPMSPLAPLSSLNPTPAPASIETAVAAQTPCTEEELAALAALDEMF